MFNLLGFDAGSVVTTYDPSPFTNKDNSRLFQNAFANITDLKYRSAEAAGLMGGACIGPVWVRAEPNIRKYLGLEKAGEIPEKVE